MATIIQQPSALELSSMLQDVIFGSTADHAVVSVICTASGDTKTIYQQTLYHSGGVIRLEDMPELVEPYARQVLSMQMVVEIKEFNAAGERTATTTTTPSTVLFGTVDLGGPVDAFLSSHFLTILNGEKMTAPGREERIYAYDATQITVTADYLADGNVVRTYTKTLNAGATTNNVSAFFVSPDNIDLLMESPDGELIGYSCQAGSRYQKFVIFDDGSVPAPSLAFINSFGCTEFIHCVGTHEKNSSYTRQSARFSGRLRNYMVREERQFKANTGWLNTPMADWADDLFRSQEVYLWVDGTIGREVVLSDSQSKITNDDDDMPSFEFTYTYSQRQHNVLQQGHAGRIFDNTFDHTFN